MNAQNLGKILGFSTAKQIEGLLKLDDGNYMKVIMVVLKVYKNDDIKSPDGLSAYSINSSPVISIWKPSEIAELEEKQ